MFAHVDDTGHVDHVVEVTSLDGLFTAGYCRDCHSCDASVQIGWRWDGNVFAPPTGPTDEELAVAIRAERGQRLAECDWTQLADSPLSDADKTAWATYRQALRDVPGQESFPISVEWPTMPE